MSGDRADDSRAATPAMLASAEQWLREQRDAPPRWRRALRLLLDSESLTARSAAKEYGDWNFKATITEIQQRGVRLRRWPELQFSSLDWRPRLVVRYSLRLESRARAAELLRDDARG